MRLMITTCAILAALVLGAMTIRATQALAASSWEDCTEGKASDLVIRACTEIITKGDESSQKLAKAYQSRCSAYNGRGHDNNHKQDFDLALADCNKAIELDAKFALAYQSRCSAYGQKQDYDRAIADCNRAIELQPEAPYSYRNRCYAYGHKQDYDRAIADCNKAIELDAKSAQAYEGYRNRCWIRAVIGQLQQALADCNESLRLSPNDSDTFDSRGLTYLKLGQYDQAIADYDAAQDGDLPLRTRDREIEKRR